MSQEPDSHGGWMAPKSESARGSVNPVVQKILWACTGALGLATWAVCLIAAAPQHLIATGAVLAGALAVTGLLPASRCAVGSLSPWPSRRWLPPAPRQRPLWGPGGS